MFRTCQYLRIVLAFKPTPQRNRNWPARTVLPRASRATRDFFGGFLLPRGAGESSAELVDGPKGRGRKPIGVSSVPSPSPRPLPWGEGESFAAARRIERAARFSPACWPRQQPLESAGEKTTRAGH